jgi:Zn-dependent peptidase ImmA (M78 family)
MNIGAKLRFARDAIGYTIEKASEKTGIGQSSISDFENNKREPRFSQLSRLADVYERKIEFFLTDKPIIERVMLWRDKPQDSEETRSTEAQFYRLCQQYRDLEILMDDVKQSKLPVPDTVEAERFDYDRAELLAKEVQEKFRLGEVPIASLKKILEEMYFVKMFYMDFSGSAISTVSPEFGPAILLNSRNKQWRRSYDLAHELFHILTWDIFRAKSKNKTEDEDRLANAFASRLLIPAESIKDRVKASVNDKSQISLSKLDDIAREFDVSLVALIYRIASLYRFKKEDTAKYVALVEKYLAFTNPRPSYEPVKLPERYRDLAVRALREGKLSLIQFAKHMNIGYKKAQEYLADDEGFTDEKISISVA